MTRGNGHWNKRALYLLLSIVFLFIFPTYVLAQDLPPEEPGISPPSAPYEVTVSGIEDTRATVSWSPVSTATQYTVWVDGQRWSGSSDPGAEIKGLQPYLEYTVYVTAANDAGEGNYSPVVLFKTLPPAPTKPEQVEISEVSETEATIQWPPLPEWQHIQMYRLFVDGQAVADVEPQEGIQAAELTNLTPGVHYISVSGINENQEGPMSVPMRFTTQAVPPPTGITLANRSHDRALLTWDVSPDADRYKVYIDGGLVGQTKENTYIIEGLDSDMDYQVGVAVLLNDGNESGIAELGIRTTPENPLMTLGAVMDAVYDYIPDVMPGIVVIFAIGGALKIARTGKFAISNRWFVFRRL